MHDVVRVVKRNTVSPSIQHLFAESDEMVWFVLITFERPVHYPLLCLVYWCTDTTPLPDDSLSKNLLPVLIDFVAAILTKYISTKSPVQPYPGIGNLRICMITEYNRSDEGDATHWIIKPSCTSGRSMLHICTDWILDADYWLLNVKYASLVSMCLWTTLSYGIARITRSECLHEIVMHSPTLAVF